MPRKDGSPTRREANAAERIVRDAKPYPPQPEDFLGSEPEWAVYWALEKVGADFDYQTSLMGGRRTPGGFVADFTVWSPAHVLINVQGEYWHYEAGGEKQGIDDLQRLQATAMGWLVIWIDGEDAMRNPVFYVEDAFRGIDHSIRGRTI